MQLHDIKIEKKFEYCVKSTGAITQKMVLNEVARHPSTVLQRVKWLNVIVEVIELFPSSSTEYLTYLVQCLGLFTSLQYVVGLLCIFVYIQATYRLGDSRVHNFLAHGRSSPAASGWVGECAKCIRYRVLLGKIGKQQKRGNAQGELFPSTLRALIPWGFSRQTWSFSAFVSLATTCCAGVIMGGRDEEQKRGQKEQRARRRGFKMTDVQSTTWVLNLRAPRLLHHTRANPRLFHNFSYVYTIGPPTEPRVRQLHRAIYTRIDYSDCTQTRNHFSSLILAPHSLPPCSILSSNRHLPHFRYIPF